jgi:hypothetical protein
MGPIEIFDFTASPVDLPKLASDALSRISPFPRSLNGVSKSLGGLRKNSIFQPRPDLPHNFDRAHPVQNSPSRDHSQRWPIIPRHCIPRKLSSVLSEARKLTTEEHHSFTKEASPRQEIRASFAPKRRWLAALQDAGALSRVLLRTASLSIPIRLNG